MTTAETSPSPTASVAGTRSEEEIAARVKALEAMLIEKGVMTTDAVDRLAEIYEKEVGPHLGARVTARAWSDDAFKERLLADATAACAELGVGGMQGEDMVVVEDTDTVHNVIVCTLCSCYPIALLGPSPSWYKSEAYRSRVVRDPRGVLREFGVELPAETRVSVWDASAESRYMVLPRRPEGTDGLPETELAGLVTRKGLIGTALV
jgi:nitrile hydratase